MKYYLVRLDTSHDFWFLSAPVDSAGQPVDPSAFMGGRHLRLNAPLVLHVTQAGERAEFSLGAYGMPILTDTVADGIREIGENDFELIPAVVAGEQGSYQVLNVTTVRDCLDTTRSDVTYWTEEDGLPERVGTYLAVTKIVIDPARTRGAHILRDQGWKAPIIVSEVVKQLLERHAVTGVVFTLCSP